MLELKGIRKRFGAVEVLKGIDLTVGSGEIVGLVGENGAGKSTLMNMLGGIYPPSEGQMSFAGRPFAPQDPADAFVKGIAFIHQELNLFPNLSIEENLLLNDLPTHHGIGKQVVSRQQLRQHAQVLLKRIGLDLPTSMLVGALTNAQQQLVEIAKAFRGAPQLIIFDEPTTSLSRHESEILFRLMSELRDQGIGMIFISHHLQEVLSITDKVVVLRDGELISQNATSSLTKETIVEDMVGRSMDKLFPKKRGEVSDQMLLDIRGLRGEGIGPLDFSIAKGEVLGFYGLVGAGRTETARAVFGLDPSYHNAIRWLGEDISHFSPAAWIKKGAVFLTEDRRVDGLMLGRPILPNVQLASLPRFAKRVLSRLSHEAIRGQVKVEVEKTRVKHLDLDTSPVAQLSGGNQQKVVLARWLMTHPKLLILDEPTKGIDIGAKEEIYDLINQIVEKGSSVWLISSEIEELLGMSDRIVVMNGGHITAEFDRRDFDEKAILDAALDRLNAEAP
ncbi:MAG: sugar ABC transporter ATP-binding protein [Bacteroidota bacterium]